MLQCGSACRLGNALRRQETVLRAQRPLPQPGQAPGQGGHRDTQGAGAGGDGGAAGSGL